MSVVNYTQYLDSSIIDDLDPTDVITLTFYGSFDAATLPIPKENGTAKAGVWTVSGDTATFTPSSYWNWGSTIVVEYSSIKDTNGAAIFNPGIEIYSSLYRDVKQDLAVVSSLPLNTNSMGAQTALKGRDTLTVVFSEPVQLTSLANPVAANGSVVAGSWAAMNFMGHVAVFTPAANWPANTNFSLDYSGALSLDGSPFVDVATESFTSITPPSSFTYLSYSTTDGDTSFENQEQVTLFFSEPVDPKTLPDFLDGKGRAVLGSWSTLGNNATFTPALPWSSYEPPVNLDSSVILSTQGDLNNNGVLINTVGVTPPVLVLFTLVSVYPNPTDATNPLTARTPVVATFDNPVTNLATLPIIREDGVQKPGSWTLGPGANEATFMPATDWDGNTTATLDPATGTNTNGTPMSGPIFNWLVPPLPFDFVSVIPADSSAIAGLQTVTLTFSDDVAPTSNIVVLQNGVAKPGTWVMQDVTATFTPSTPWSSGAAVTINTAAAVSVDGVTNTTPHIVSYTIPVTFTQTAVTPTMGSSIFGTDTISVTFNEVPDPLMMPFPTEDGITKSGTWVQSANTLTYTPASPWAPNATVIVDWSFATDTLGNTPTNPGIASYTVKDLFTFVSSTPGAGGYLIYKNPISLTFNRAINPATLPMPMQNSVARAGTWTFVGNVATFTPFADWAFGVAISLNYAAGISTDGVPLSNPGTLAYTVPNQLVQTGVTPATGSILNGASPVTVTFNQAVDVNSLPLPINQGGTSVLGTWTTAGATATFTPGANWALSSSFTVNWSAVRSLFNLPVTNPGTATYSSIPEFSATSVSPITGSPIWGTNGVSVTFNRAVDVSSLLHPTSNGVFVAGSWSVSGSTATFTPTNPWVAGETVVMGYTVAADTLGNVIVNPNSATYLAAAELFQTATAVEHSTTLAALDKIYVTFDQPINISTMPLPKRTDTNVNIAGTWVMNGNVAEFTPTSSWRLNLNFPAYTVQVDWSAVTSVAGALVSNPGTQQWGVVLASLISSFTDPNNSTIATTDADLVWDFTNGTPTSNPPITYSDSSLVPGTWLTTASQMTFTPSQSYIPGETISVDWDAVADANGHPPHNAAGGVWTLLVEDFKYVSFATGDMDGNVRDLETVTFTFNAPVDLATLPTGFTTSDATPLTGLGSWSALGNTVTFTPSQNWQTTGVGPYRFDLRSVSDVNGNAVSNGLIVPVAEEPAPFTFVSLVTGESDGDVRDLETFTVTFSSPPRQPMMMPEDSTGILVSGTWTYAGNTATFTPSSPWQSYTPDFTLNLDAAYSSTIGVLIGNPQVVPIPIEPLSFSISTYVGRGFDNDTDLLESEAVRVTFLMGTPSLASLNTSVITDANGAVINGTWSVGVLQADFAITGAWDNYTGPFNFNMSSVVSDGGVPLSGATSFQMGAEPFVGIQSWATASGDQTFGEKEASDKLIVTFQSPPDPASFTWTTHYAMQNADGSGIRVLPYMTGSWSAGPGPNDMTFTYAGEPGPYRSDRRSILIYLFGAKCGGVRVLPTMLTVPITPQPRLVSVTPADQTLAKKQQIVLNFNTRADGQTMPTVLEGGAPKAGTWDTTSANNSPSFTPTADWTPGAFVTLNTTGMFETFSGESIPFANTGPINMVVQPLLTLTSVLSASGDTVLNGNENIVVDFNNVVTSLNRPIIRGVGGSVIAGTWAAALSDKMTFTPSSNWSSTDTPITVEIPANITDVDGQTLGTSQNRVLTVPLVMSAAGPSTFVSGLLTTNQQRYVIGNAASSVSGQNMATGLSFQVDGVRLDMATLPLPRNQNGNVIPGSYAEVLNFPVANLTTYRYTYTTPLTETPTSYVVINPAGVRDTTGAYVWEPGSLDLVQLICTPNSTARILTVPARLKQSAPNTDTTITPNFGTLDPATVVYTVNGVPGTVSDTGTGARIVPPAGGFAVGDMVVIDLRNAKQDGGAALLVPSQPLTYTVVSG